jgi:hypothetical protein
MRRDNRPIITLLAIALPVSASLAQSPPRLPDDLARTHLYRQVKLFDFDERPLGNFEDTPMHWTKLVGPGLPFYSQGQFDESVGHGGAPCFRLDIRTGNVAYEYDHLDLTVLPYSDYVLEAWIRAEGLEHSRAFIATYFVDHFEERIPGSQRISELFADTRGAWRHLSIDMPGDHPTAYAMRVQLWILHSYAWRERDPSVIDPITRRDTNGAAWFDDIQILRLPRARLRFSDPAGLVHPGSAEAVILEVSNVTRQALEGELSIVDSFGVERHRESITVPGIRAPADEPTTAWAGAEAEGIVFASGEWGELGSIRVALPSLPVGDYQASLRLIGESRVLLERRVRFAVLPELEAPQGREADIGVELGPWRGGSVRGMERALRGLRICAAKIGVPMIGALDDAEKTAYYTDIRELVRSLAQQNILSTGVILTQSAALNDEPGEPTVKQVRQRDQFAALVGPIFAHFGGLLTSWQLGDESLETTSDSWTPAEVEIVQSQLQRFITFPQLVTPLRASESANSLPMSTSFLAAGDIPARDFPRMLDFLLEPSAHTRWLSLGWPDARDLTYADRISDRARRLILAKAMAPDRVYVPVPLTNSAAGGQLSWEPTEDYIWLRTLTHYLSGRVAVAALRLGDGAQAIVFQGAQDSCLVLWSWARDPAPVDLYLGPIPVATDLFGVSTALPVTDGRARIPVSEMPLIIRSLDTPQVLLQASCAVAPSFVQIHDSRPRPVLAFRNPFDGGMSGEVNLAGPPDWRFEPASWAFSLAPGERMEKTLEFRLPARQLASDYTLEVEIRIDTPDVRVLRFSKTIQLGLRDVELTAATHWVDGDLVVEQSLRNRSNVALGFSAFCEPPGWGRQESAFLGVEPGQTSSVSYVFPAARELAGATLHHGIEEIRGKRRLDQVVQVPRE